MNNALRNAIPLVRYVNKLTLERLSFVPQISLAGTPGMRAPSRVDTLLKENLHGGLQSMGITGIRLGFELFMNFGETV